MPNTGKPSQDCHLCRSRRVKCDLGRPSCQRCIKYGAECPGYRDQQDLMFRNANPTTVKKRKKRAEQPHQAGQAEVKWLLSPESSDASASASRYSTPPTVLDGLSPDSTSTDLIPLNDCPATSTQMRLPLARPLSEHWTAHSVPIVLNVYSTLEFLSGMYSTCPSDGPLVWAAHLFARTYVTNLRYPTAVHNESVVDSQRELGSYMGKALSAVSSALQEPDGAFRDDILATVWILSNYELLVGSIGRMQVMSPWHLHTRGLYSILKTRGISSLRSNASRAAFWSSFHLVQVEAIISSTEGPPETEEWLAIIRENMFEEEHLAVTVASFMSKAAGIQSRMLSTLRRNDYETASDEYLSLVGELSRAEDAADTSFASVPGVLDPFDTYWRNIYCAALVKVHHITHLYVNFLTHHVPCPISLDQLQSQRGCCLQRVRTAANEIITLSTRALDTRFIRANKSPKTLFDAMKVVWPLTAVYIIPSTLPEQKTQAEMALHFIGRELGIRQALHTYPGQAAGRVPSEAQTPLQIGEPENFAWVGRLLMS